MSVIDTSDKNKVVSVAEGGIPVTGAMIEQWCKAYENGELPEGYEVEGTVSRGRPPLHREKMASMSIRLTNTEKEDLKREARELGISTSTYLRRIIALRNKDLKSALSISQKKTAGCRLAVFFCCEEQSILKFRRYLNIYLRFEPFKNRGGTVLHTLNHG